MSEQNMSQAISNVLSIFHYIKTRIILSESGLPNLISSPVLNTTLSHKHKSDDKM